MMDLKENWNTITHHFKKTFWTNLHYSIASVDENNQPTVTPIGSVFLNDDCTGFYFEMFATKLRANANHNKNICILAVNSSYWFWLKSLIKEKFNSHPAIKLYGTLGGRRKANAYELQRLHKAFPITMGINGVIYLKRSCVYVREITFTRAEKINAGKLTSQIKK